MRRKENKGLLVVNELRRSFDRCVNIFLGFFFFSKFLNPLPGQVCSPPGGQAAGCSQVSPFEREREEGKKEKGERGQRVLAQKPEERNRKEEKKRDKSPFFFPYSWYARFSPFVLFFPLTRGMRFCLQFPCTLCRSLTLC